MLSYDELAGGLHYHAYRYQCGYFEHWELVNEAWIAVHKMNNIKLARVAIPWRMLDYMRSQDVFRNRGRYRSDKRKMRTMSLHAPITEDLMLKDVICRPNRYNDIVDNVDTINWLADNGHLTLDERVMLDQRFYKGMTFGDIGKCRHVSESRVSQVMKLVILKLQAAARRLRGEDTLVHTRQSNRM